MGPRWGATGLVALGQLVAWGTLYYSYALLAPSLATDLRVGPGAVALAFSATLLVAGLLAPVVGRWLDRRGAVVVLRWASGVGPAALLLLASARTPLALWAAFLGLGVAQALSLYEPAFRAAVDWFRQARHRGRALLLITSVGGFASTVFVPMTAALVRDHGWRAATLALALMLALVQVPIAQVLSWRTAPRSAMAPAGPGVPPLEVPQSHWLGLAFAAPAFASAAVAVALVWLLVDRGQPLTAAAMITGLAGAAQVPGRLLLAPLQGRVATPRRVAGSLVVQAVALAAVARGPAPLLVPAVLVYGALNGMLTLERAAIVVEWYGVERFGAVSGALARYALIARAAAPTAVAAIAGVASLHVAFLLVAAAVGAGAVAFAMAAVGRRQGRMHAPGLTPRARPVEAPLGAGSGRVSHLEP